MTCEHVWQVESITPSAEPETFDLVMRCRLCSEQQRHEACDRIPFRYRNQDGAVP